MSGQGVFQIITFALQIWGLLRADCINTAFVCVHKANTDVRVQPL